MEQALQANNPKHAFGVVKKLRKGFCLRRRNVNDEKGRVLSDLEDIKRRWRTYTEQLYND